MTDKAAERTEILRRLDILAEFQAIGLRVATNAQPNDNGWLKCHSLYRTDNNPSAGINVGDGFQRGIYVDFGENGWGGKLWLTKGIFNVLAEIGSTYVTGRDAYYILGKKVGVIQPIDKRVPKPPPTLDDVKRFQKNLTPEIRQFLQDKRGLSEASLAKFEIGWDPKRERHAFPVYVPAPVGKTLVNIRFHNSKKTPKTLSWPGFGEARLWGLDRLAAAAPGSTVGLLEGELDAALFDQETGFIGVSSTNGVKAFKPEWTNHFHGHHVVVMYDCDQAGREGVQHLILPAFKEAVTAGRVLSLKVVWLYDTQDKEHKDLTDWIVKDGGSGEALKKLIEETPPYTYPTATSHLPKPIELASFTQIDKSEYAGQRVTVPLLVYGENSEAYHAVTRVRVTSCRAIKEGKCTGPRENPGACLEPIEVPLGHRVQLASVAASDTQLKGSLRDFVCDQDKRPALIVEDQDRLTIREVYAHQVVGPMSVDRTELVEKPIYVMGGGMVEIGKYQATGMVLASPRGQRPTILVDTLERLEEDYQTFDLDRSHPQLKKLQALSPQEIVKDLTQHVTRIYERDDLHLGCLLTLCSPLWINLPGEGRIRGWLSAIVIGDTGTGKTTIAQSIFEYAGVGTRVSGMTSSRTGITYACDYDERRGWRVKAGAFLKMSRQAMILDEAQDLKMEDLKSMAEGIDTGLTKIDRIQAKVFESATRVIFNCNPRHPQKYWEQRTMDSYRYGCEAIQGIFPQMMIRRVDLVMFATAWDIEDKEKIFFPQAPDTLPQLSSKDLQALIFYAWNLKEDQIVISENTAKYIRQTAKYLSKIFGGCDDLPIVYPEDFRKTLARLCVAYAVLDLSTNEDFTRVIIEPHHVAEVCEFLEKIYRAENCRLHHYAKAYLESHGLGDYEDIRQEIGGILCDPKKSHRFLYILNRLLKTRNGEGVKKSELTEELEEEKVTVQREMQFFTKRHLCRVNSRIGYIPEPKLFKLINRIEQAEPDLLRFDGLKS